MTEIRKIAEGVDRSLDAFDKPRRSGGIVSGNMGEDAVEVLDGAWSEPDLHGFR
jgi:hypothetical protein